VAHDHAVTELDVMVLESEPGAACTAVTALRRAGHRVHRCHEPGLGSFPCNGLLDAKTCPLAAHVDVTLLVRSHVSPTPTPFEDGVSCAIRAGVPLVEAGPEVLDPFEPWVSVRAGGHDLVAACETAALRRLEPLLLAIRDRIDLLLARRAVDPATVDCHVERDGHRMRVRLTGADFDSRLRQALAVRVLDGVRAGRAMVGDVDVVFEENDER
jgi:hypothetical protein